jgi:hypothetical protein
VRAAAHVRWTKEDARKAADWLHSHDTAQQRQTFGHTPMKLQRRLCVTEGYGTASLPYHRIALISHLRCDIQVVLLLVRLVYDQLTSSSSFGHTHWQLHLLPRLYIVSQSLAVA